MKKEYQDVISDALGVQPIEINSSLVSAQSRKRLYWSNIPNIKQPKDKGILLKDILHNNSFVDKEKSYCIDANYAKSTNLKTYFEKKKRRLVFGKIIKVGNTNSSSSAMNGNVFEITGKSPILTTNKGEGIKITGAAIRRRSGNRQLEINNTGQANSLTTFRESSLVAIKQCGYGFNKGGLFTYKSPTLSSNSWEHNNQLTNDMIQWRKLTPIECERLQTLPDNFTFGISNSQRYKCLGNAWTIDVIAHILKEIKKCN